MVQILACILTKVYWGPSHKSMLDFFKDKKREGERENNVNNAILNIEHIPVQSLQKSHHHNVLWQLLWCIYCRQGKSISPLRDILL